jgi:hypothetical protein
MIKIILLIIFLILSINNIYCLKSDEICYKQYECNGKHCTLLNCTGLFSYDCRKYECTLNENICDEYESLREELNLKKNLKLDRANTVGLIKGISFSSRRLKKFEFLIKQIKLCVGQ